MIGKMMILAVALATLLAASCRTRSTQVQQVPEPILDPPGGSYLYGQTITVSCAAEDARIYYTTDGTDPSEQSALYTAPFTIPAIFAGEEMSGTIRVKAYKTGWNPSPVVSADYTAIYAGTVAPPQIKPEEYDIESGSLIVITSATPDAEIRYTLDGSDPSPASPLYGGAFPLTQTGTVTVKARGFKPSFGPSLIATAIYTVSENELVRVLGGTFNNGTADVTINTFYMGKYEVTQEQYLAVMNYDPASTHGDGPNYPVYQVSWMNAIEYCNRLSMMNGLEPCYRYGSYGTDPSNWPSGWDTTQNNENHNNVIWDIGTTGYRLPTEMEWMFAARGGNRSRNLAYAGSANLSEVGWWTENAAETSHPVGLKQPNELGIYDMSGDVREWVWNLWGDYPTLPQEDPTGPQNGLTRINRGGGWGSPELPCQVGSRTSNNPTYKGLTTGFRICRRY